MVENNINTLYKEVIEILKPITPNYMFEAKQLICTLLNISQNDFIMANKTVDKKDYDMVVSFSQKRAIGYPLQYILGEWEFYGKTYKVGEGVLIPRDDTEVLCETLINLYKDKSNLKVVDLCSGSGCIAITLEDHLKNASVYAVEKSEIAFDYLNQNIKLNSSKVNPVLDDVLNPKTDIADFDIIVSNPPYLTLHDMNTLQKEVTHEPKMALYGEEDGLYFYKKITKVWTNRLKKGGVLAFEIGKGQEDDVNRILLENGYDNICKKKDLYGIIRVILAEK